MISWDITPPPPPQREHHGTSRYLPLGTQCGYSSLIAHSGSCTAHGILHPPLPESITVPHGTSLWEHNVATQASLHIVAAVQLMGYYIPPIRESITVPHGTSLWEHNVATQASLHIVAAVQLLKRPVYLDFYNHASITLHFIFWLLCNTEILDRYRNPGMRP